MKNIHSTIIYWSKVVLFSVFIGNVLRVCIRTWKYGGSKTKVDVSYDGDEELNPMDDSIGGV
jgi:hypothetical protein